jgi:nitrate/TMAO reductase-like tetraheme cytochrome c subunit
VTDPGAPDGGEDGERSLGSTVEDDARTSGADAPGPDAAAAEPRRGRLRRIAARFAWLPHPSVRTRRGRFILFVLIAGFGVAISAAGVTAIRWTETADFCGRCHTMGPELKAYAQSPHRDVACAECHVEPGVAGWIKAKINGTRQLVLVLTGAYPAPIPAPDHADLPPTSQTCVRCHDVAGLLDKGGSVKLLLDERYRQDEQNTRDTIALVVRPVGFGGESVQRGVHWHIGQEVDYRSSDARAQTIDYVAVTEPSGVVKEYLASSAVNLPSDVRPDLDRLKHLEGPRRMDCIDCHNRIGHGVPSPDQAVDDSLAAGKISADLPYIKREADDRLSIEYASTEDADRALDELRSFYLAQYPLVASTRRADIDEAIGELKLIYRLVATPEMRVTGTTYPNNLGHLAAPGCFRCHDGAHYLVENGVQTQTTIPSACATCHTFPQIGSVASGVLIGERPSTHGDRLWVFSHKNAVTTRDPAGTSCGACHTRTYCQNCHDTKAVNVPHDDMVYNHGAVFAQVGAPACAYCHQPAYCAQCHADDVLPAPYPVATPAPAANGRAGP